MRKFFTKKKIIWTVIILLVAGGIASQVVKGNDPSKNIVTDTVKTQDLEQTVLATGQVVSETDLSLSFKMGGIVQQVNVKEGQAVKQGDVLATLDQRDQQANLTSARGTLAQANANYQRVIDGASSEEITVAQRAVDAAKVTLENARQNLTIVTQQQVVLVQNAKSALLNSTPAAVAASANLNSTPPTISGTYTGAEEGVYTIHQEGLTFYVRGLESRGNLKMESNTLMPLGTKGLYIQFPSSMTVAQDSWTVTIPNPKAANYITNLNAYQAALETSKNAISSAEASVKSAEVALSQVEASLSLKRAQARPADLDAARAQILSAQGQVQAAEASLENAILRAPASGTITTVSIKPGEQSTALKEVMILQDVESLHIEANVSEANIAALRPGQTIDVTFDALGPERKFSATVQTVNPASTVVSGVVNYKVVASLEDLPEIKPGMTANLTVLITERKGVLAVPSRAVISQDGAKVVRIVTDPKKKTYEEVEVTTGLEADGGLVEIRSGLDEGQEIVTLIKK